MPNVVSWLFVAMLAGLSACTGAPDDGPTGAAGPGGPLTSTTVPTSSPSRATTAGGVRIEVRSHCGVLSVTVAGRLWIADPALGDHNPPPGWDENRTPGSFVQTGKAAAEFHGDQGQYAAFRLAAPGTPDPGADCN